MGNARNKRDIKSTVPGLAYPPSRDIPLRTAFGYLQGRRQVDGAEGLWRIRNGLYDLESFAKSHPGGAEWIHLTKNTDITEIFETHHLTDKAERILPKFYIRDATEPRSVPLTFEPDGFYCKFKKRAVEALKDVDFHRPSRLSNLIADSLLIATFCTCLAAAYSNSVLTTIPAGIFLVWTTVIAHNYFHMRDNFRMYYFDLSLMSSKDWRISHVMSHHMYPNTLWDHEVYAIEPFLQWLPYEKKSIFARFLSQIISPFVYSLLYIGQGLKRYYSVIWEYKCFEIRDVIPFILPLTMYFVAPSALTALKTWIIILLISSLLFGTIGFNAAHHHPDIFHDGDIYRDNLDWGLLEVDAVRDRKVVDDVPFLILTNFGSHALHHLLPTIDHCYLSLTVPAYLQTCKEFGIDTERWTQWELMKGQFRQLSRVTTKKNQR